MIGISKENEEILKKIQKEVLDACGFNETPITFKFNDAASNLVYRYPTDKEIRIQFKYDIMRLLSGGIITTKQYRTLKGHFYRWSLQSFDLSDQNGKCISGFLKRIGHLYIYDDILKYMNTKQPFLHITKTVKFNNVQSEICEIKISD